MACHCRRQCNRPAGFIVVLDRLPRHLSEVAVECRLVAVLADEYDFKLFRGAVDLGILLGQSGCESAAAGGPVSTEVETCELDTVRGVSEGLHGSTLSDELVS